MTYFARDYVGNQETSQSLTVGIDRTRPTISGMPDDSCVLWPPNGKWRHVATVSASDALSGIDPASLHVAIESSEPPDSQSPDFLVPSNEDGAVDVLLRAKRLGGGSGRVYSLTATVRDLAGNVAARSSTCVVPHDQQKQ